MRISSTPSQQASHSTNRIPSIHPTPSALLRRGWELDIGSTTDSWHLPASLLPVGEWIGASAGTESEVGHDWNTGFVLGAGKGLGGFDRRRNARLVTCLMIYSRMY